MKSRIDTYLNNLKHGDIKSLGFLYDLTSKQLFGLCYSYFKNKEQSEDALSDAYLKIVQEIDKFNGKNGFNWIYTITKNICINKIKNNKIVTTNLNEKDIIDDRDNNKKETDMILEIANRVLDEKEYKILILHAMYGYKFKDIAQILDENESTLRWRYSNALSKVRKEYDDYER